jgi:ParB family transcriptional regulator, chromosome partitioning protein
MSTSREPALSKNHQGVPSLAQTSRRGLGRGLGALIPTAPAEEQPTRASVAELRPMRPVGADSPETMVSGAWFAELPLDSVVPNPRQPRQVFDPDALAELAHSLREVGLLQPVVVRPVAADRYELIMGERRWRAAQQAGFTSIPAIVRSTEDDAMLLDALLENLHRAALNPL